MIINTDNLRISLPHKVKRIDKKEVFFQIPGHKRYLLSNYGRLCQMTDTGAWHIQHMEQDNLIDFYEIDGKRYPILALIKCVFFNGMDVNLEKSNNQNPYMIEDIIVNHSKEEKNELLLFTKKGINEWLDDKYTGIVRKATNLGYKAKNPQYKNTTMSEDWLKNSDHCKQYLLDMKYYYPEELDVDKDLISFGTINEYREGNVLLLPGYINRTITRGYSKLGYGISQNTLQDGKFSYSHVYYIDIFSKEQVSRTFSNYFECLEFARQKKFEQLHNIVEYEWEQGFLPEYILELLEQLADGIKSGTIKLREPSDEVLKEMEMLS